jgi:hypothetical protein
VTLSAPGVAFADAVIQRAFEAVYTAWATALWIHNYDWGSKKLHDMWDSTQDDAANRTASAQYWFGSSAYNNRAQVVKVYTQLGEKFVLGSGDGDMQDIGGQLPYRLVVASKTGCLQAEPFAHVVGSEIRVCSTWESLPFEVRVKSIIRALVIGIEGVSEIGFPNTPRDPDSYSGWAYDRFVLRGYCSIKNFIEIKGKTAVPKADLVLCDIPSWSAHSARFNNFTGSQADENSEISIVMNNYYEAAQRARLASIVAFWMYADTNAWNNDNEREKRWHKREDLGLSFSDFFGVFSPERAELVWETMALWESRFFDGWPSVVIFGHTIYGLIDFWRKGNNQDPCTGAGVTLGRHKYPGHIRICKDSLSANYYDDAAAYEGWGLIFHELGHHLRGGLGDHTSRDFWQDVDEHLKADNIWNYNEWVTARTQAMFDHLWCLPTLGADPGGPP